MVKESVYLYAYQRATPYWSEDCAMTREEAASYYSQEFVNPSGVYEAYDVSNALFWINSIYAGLLALCLLFLFCVDMKWVAGTAGSIAICARVCWIITIPIVYHRLDMSYNSALVNLDVLKSQETFVPYAKSCGNPLYALNYD